MLCDFHVVDVTRNADDRDWNSVFEQRGGCHVGAGGRAVFAEPGNRIVHGLASDRSGEQLGYLRGILVLESRQEAHAEQLVATVTKLVDQSLVDFEKATFKVKNAQRVVRLVEQHVEGVRAEKDGKGGWGILVTRHELHPARRA